MEVEQLKRLWQICQFTHHIYQGTSQVISYDSRPRVARRHVDFLQNQTLGEIERIPLLLFRACIFTKYNIAK